MPTKIEWTKNADGSQGESFNPAGGCRRVSPGCTNCYAERQAYRLAHNPNRKVSARYAGITKLTNGRPGWTGNTFIDDDVLLQPLKKRQPTTYFISLSDLFYTERPDADIDRVFLVMAQCKRHTFQVLTKYVARAAEYLSAFKHSGPFDGFITRGGCTASDSPDGSPIFNPANWPLRNVHLGVSVESQQYWDQRYPWLATTPAAVRFISYEPALGPIDFRFAEQLVLPDQVIIGAESGPGARPFNEDWARSARDQCTAAGIPFFYKQKLDGKGKKVSLPVLDGRSWAQLPRGAVNDQPHI